MPNRFAKYAPSEIEAEPTANRFARYAGKGPDGGPADPAPIAMAKTVWGNLVGPGAAAFEALKTDASRFAAEQGKAPDPTDWREWVPGYDKKGRIAGSVAQDAWNLGTSWISGPLNAGYVDPGARLMAMVPGMGDLDKNREIFSTSLLGVGPKGGMGWGKASGPFRQEPPFVRQSYTGPRSGGGRFRTAGEAEEQFKARGGSSTAGSDRFTPPPKPEPPPAAAAGPAPRAEAVPPHKVIAGARMDAESRFETDAGGHVLAENGDTHAFADQKAAARWIISHGQKASADQIFEIANHPADRGAYAVKESGRAPNQPDPLNFVIQGEELGAEALPARVEAPPAAEAPPGGGAPPPPPPKGPPAAPGARPEPLPFVAEAGKGKPSAEKTLPQAIGDWVSKLYTGAVAEQHPLVRAVEQLRSGIEAQTGKPLNLKPSADPRKLARGGIDLFNIGHMDIMHGVHAYHGVTPGSPALGDVIAAATGPDVRFGDTPAKSLNRFSSYLTALRGVEEWDRYGRGEIPNEPLPASRDDLLDYLQRAESANSHYAALADAVNEYGRALWTKSFDAGLIDAETYAAANASRHFYVPFRRVQDASAAKEATGASNKGGQAKKFKGSERDVIDPVESLVKQTYELNRRVQQNDLNRSLVDLAQRLDGLLQASTGDPEASNGLLRKLKAPVKPITLSPEELKKFGIDRAFDDESVTAWRAGDINEGGRPIIYAWRDGKREAWELTDPEWGRDTFQAVSGMTTEVQELWSTVLGAAAQTLRAGITTHPTFILSNLIRDQMTSWVLTDVGFVPGEGAIGTAQELAGSDTSRLYALGGGISGGQMVAAVSDAAIHADIMALRHQGFRAQYLSSLLDIFKFAEVTETGTRLRVFSRAFERALAEGMDPYDAVREGAFLARDVLDFGRSGSKMHIARKIIPFLNASLQGLDKGLRVLGADGAMTRIPLKDAIRPLFVLAPPGMRREDAKAIRTAYKAYGKMAAIAAFGLALTALYRDDPEYANISEYGRATAWWVKMGGGEWFAIPKPFQEGMFSTIVERSFEAAYNDDPKAYERLLRGMTQTLALPMDNPFIKEPFEQAANRDVDTGRPIIPQGKEDLLPEDQYAYWSSTFSKSLAAHLNPIARKYGWGEGVSPAKLDHAIAGFGGSWGQTALALGNMTDPDRPEGTLADNPLTRRFVHDWTRGAQDRTDFYDRVGGRTSELATLLGSVRERVLAGSPSAGRALIDAATPEARTYVQSQLADDGKSKNLNPLTRAGIVGTEVTRIINEMYGDRPKGLQARGGEPDDESLLPKLSPHEKRTVRDALDQLVVAEMHNAMVVTGQPGFAERPLMARQHYMAQLEAASPQVAAAFKRRLLTGREKAYDYDAVMQAWPEASARLKKDGEGAQLLDLMNDVKGASVGQ